MTTSLHTSGLAVRGVRATNPMSQLARLVRGALQVRRERAHLAQLDDHTLADMGLTRDQALAEAARPIWDVPVHWRA